MPTTRPSARSRRSWRTASTRRMPGTSSATWTSPWTRCAARRTTPKWPPCRVARSVAWRCAGCCSSIPTCCCSTSPPTTWMPSRSTGWSASWPSTAARSWPSPTTGTSWTTSRSGSWSSTAVGASRSPATTPAGWSRSWSACPGAEAGGRQAADPGPGAGVGAPVAQGPPVEGQGPSLGLRAAAGRGPGREGRHARAGDRHPARPAAGRAGHRCRGPAQGLRGPAAHRGPDVLAAAVRHRGHHRAQRRGQDDAVPDAGRARSARTRAPSRSAAPSS